MRDWFGMFFGNVGAWLVAMIDWNGISVTIALVASIVTGITAIICGISKSIEQKHRRNASYYAEIRESKMLCKLCQESEYPIRNCPTPNQYCNRKESQMTKKTKRIKLSSNA